MSATDATPSDEALMASFQATADEEAFEELSRRRLPAAHRIALAILGNESAAEDALQEACLKMVRARHTYRPGSPFAAWFYAILKNACRDELRRVRNPGGRKAAGLELIDECDPGSVAERRDDARSACQAFERLPDREREVLALRIYGDLEFGEVAAVCGISTEAAKKRAHRGLARLRRALASLR